MFDECLKQLIQYIEIKSYQIRSIKQSDFLKNLYFSSFIAEVFFFFFFFWSIFDQLIVNGNQKQRLTYIFNEFCNITVMHPFWMSGVYWQNNGFDCPMDGKNILISVSLILEMPSRSKYTHGFCFCSQFSFFFFQLLR